MTNFQMKTQYTKSLTTSPLAPLGPAGPGGPGIPRGPGRPGAPATPGRPCPAEGKRYYEPIIFSVALAELVSFRANK